MGNSKGDIVRKCPKCREEIAEGAIKCKHCGADLRNWFARHKFLTGFFILIVLIIIISAASGDKDKNTSTTASNSGSSTQTADTNKTYKTGDTIQLKNHSLTVNTVNKNYKSGNQFDKPQDSNNSFVVVNVTLNNTGNDDLSANQFGFKLEDETGVQRNTTIVTTVADTLQSVTLSKGGKLTGNLVFEAKTGSSVLKLHYEGGMFGGEEIIVNL